MLNVTVSSSGVTFTLKDTLMTASITFQHTTDIYNEPYILNMHCLFYSFM